jgi:neutral ceramidase
MGCAGFAKTPITPAPGVELAGYGVYLQRRANAVYDDLFARALSLEDDTGERVLMLSLDLIGLSWELDRAIASQAGAAAGLDAERVLVSCTHTHSGPATLPMEGWGEIEPRYLERIPSLCAAVAAEATAALHPVRIGAGHGAVRALGFNRVHPEGAIDRSLHVLRIDRMDGTPEVVVFSHGCHPVSIDRRTGAGTAISGDWPGQVTCRLQDEGYGEAIFRLGVCGDIDPVVAWHNFAFEGMELSAELVTASLLALLRSVEPMPGLRLRLARRDVALPLVPLHDDDIAAVLAGPPTRYGSVRVTDSGADATTWPRFHDAWAKAMRAQHATQPEQLSVPLAALRIDDDVWLHLPGEIFTALGEAIRERSPFPETVVTTLFGPFIGYLPDRGDFAAGGYAATLVPRILQVPPFSPAVGDTLVSGAVALLESLENRGGM